MLRDLLRRTQHEDPEIRRRTVKVHAHMHAYIIIHACTCYRFLKKGQLASGRGGAELEGKHKSCRIVCLCMSSGSIVHCVIAASIVSRLFVPCWCLLPTTRPTTRSSTSLLVRIPPFLTTMASVSWNTAWLYLALTTSKHGWERNYRSWGQHKCSECIIAISSSAHSSINLHCSGNHHALFLLAHTYSYTCIYSGASE